MGDIKLKFDYELFQHMTNGIIQKNTKNGVTCVTDVINDMGEAIKENFIVTASYVSYLESNVFVLDAGEYILDIGIHVHNGECECGFKGESFQIYINDQIVLEMINEE